VHACYNNACILTVTGSDSTSTGLSAVIFYLLHNPAALSRVVEEVRSIFSNEEDIRLGQQLNSCRYLRGCINEALRLAPPVTGLAPRCVLPGGIAIGNKHFPEGTIVGTPIYTIHHNEAYFPDPFLFKPERWIVNPELGYTEDVVKLAHSAFFAFSTGPSSCVAKSLAWTEISITTARTLYSCDLRLDPSHVHGISQGCSKTLE
jgi:cytochrome P450